MRKYQQLLLLVVSIVCIVTVLFYRHEYLKLRSVLGVLNFFGGADCSNSTCSVFSNNLTKDITSKYQFEEPRSVWTKLDDHYLYSSFWEDNEEGGFIRTLVIGPQSAFFNYKCRIWFEKGDIILSEEGQLKYDVDLRPTGDTSIHKYFLKCIVQNKPTYAVPYGVLWSTSKTSQPSTVFSPIFYRPRAKLLDSVVCVVPDYSGLPKKNILEFIAYYNTIGVSNFIIYDYGIQHSVFPFLESIAGRNGIVSSVSVLRWNFPISNPKVERLAIDDDCLSRTYGKAKFVAIVSWDDYIVPKNYKLSEMVSANKITDILNLSMKRQLCCTNTADVEPAKSSWPLFLRKKQCIMRDTVDDTLFINFKSYSVMNKKRIYEVSEEIGVINQYGFCNKTSQKQATMISIPDYYSNLNSHRLLALWKAHLNTTSIFSWMYQLRLFFRAYHFLWMYFVFIFLLKYKTFHLAIFLIYREEQNKEGRKFKFSSFILQWDYTWTDDWIILQ